MANQNCWPTFIRDKIASDLGTLTGLEIVEAKAAANLKSGAELKALDSFRGPVCSMSPLSFPISYRFGAAPSVFRLLRACVPSPARRHSETCIFNYYIDIASCDYAKVTI